MFAKVEFCSMSFEKFGVPNLFQSLIFLGNGRPHGLSDVMWHHMQRAACGAMIAESLELGTSIFHDGQCNGDISSWDNERFVNDGFIQNGDFQQREITKTILPNYGFCFSNDINDIFLFLFFERDDHRGSPPAGCNGINGSHFESDRSCFFLSFMA